MTSAQTTNRLHLHLNHMIAVETAIEQKLKELVPQVSVNNRASTLLKDYQTLAGDHRQALEDRLRALTDDESVSKESTVALPVSETNYPVSTALQTAYTLLNQAVIGYAVLHPLATRFVDSSLTADDGTSYHLTRQHTQDYIEAIQQISQLLYDVVLWELDQAGLECQCYCPSCRVGICVCAKAGRSFLRDAWAEVGPIKDDQGVYVQPPRQNSAAAKAGLRQGDVIFAADDREIETHFDLQGAVGNVQSGEKLRLKVRRDSDVMEIAVVCP